ncbi:hypothetical protein M8J77_016084 [Diaphorina citri]|nr:hypothetical protein M8J77_016084 [Diaphorina citri]
MEEKARLKTHVNIYNVNLSDTKDVQDGGNTIETPFQQKEDITLTGLQQSKPTDDGSKSTPATSAALFQQIAALSQMKTRYKSNTRSGTTVASSPASEYSDNPVQQKLNGHRGGRTHLRHSRIRRSINTDYVSKKGKE